MSRIPWATARRIDRLAKGAHAFHRFAHHPLCNAYEGEVLRFGRMRICKGCTLVALGALIGALLGWLCPRLSLQALFAIGILTLLWVGMVFHWSWLRRIGKVGNRMLPSMMASFLGLQGLQHAGVWGLVLILGACLALPVAMMAYRRRGAWRGPCEACPEREVQPCSGYRPQVRRERAFKRMVGRWLGSPSNPSGL